MEPQPLPNAYDESSNSNFPSLGETNETLPTLDISKLAGPPSDFLDSAPETLLLWGSQNNSSHILPSDTSKVSLEKDNSSFSTMSENKWVLEFQPVKQSYHEQVDKFMEKMMIKNKTQMIDKCLSSTKLSYEFVKFQKENDKEKVSQMKQTPEENEIKTKQVSNLIPLKFVNLKASTYQQFLKIDVKTNTRLFIDLKDFSQQQTIETLETLKSYHLNYLSIKFANKKDLFSLSLHPQTRNLSLNFGSCKQKAQTQDIDFVSDASLSFNKLDSLSLNQFQINLCKNGINTENFPFVTNIFSKVKSVNTLFLDFRLNTLQLSQIKQIFSFIESLQTLTSLNLSLNGSGYTKNQLENGSQNGLFTGISKLKSLQKFIINLSNINFDDNGLNNLKNILAGLKILKYVDIDISSNDKLQSTAVIKLLEELNNCESIHSFKLNIDGILISNQGALKMIQTITQFKFLKELFIKADYSNDLFRSIRLYQEKNQKKQVAKIPSLLDQAKLDFLRKHPNQYSFSSSSWSSSQNQIILKSFFSSTQQPKSSSAESSSLSVKKSNKFNRYLDIPRIEEEIEQQSRPKINSENKDT